MLTRLLSSGGVVAGGSGGSGGRGDRALLLLLLQRPLGPTCLRACELCVSYALSGAASLRGLRGPVWKAASLVALGPSHVAHTYTTVTGGQQRQGVSCDWSVRWRLFLPGPQGSRAPARSGHNLHGARSVGHRGVAGLLAPGEASRQSTQPAEPSPRPPQNSPAHSRPTAQELPQALTALRRCPAAAPRPRLRAGLLRRRPRPQPDRPAVRSVMAPTPCPRPWRG
jgi:hypothetical protein